MNPSYNIADSGRQLTCSNKATITVKDYERFFRHVIANLARLEYHKKIVLFSFTL